MQQQDDGGRGDFLDKLIKENGIQPKPQSQIDSGIDPWANIKGLDSTTPTVPNPVAQRYGSDQPGTKGTFSQSVKHSMERAKGMIQDSTARAAESKAAGNYGEAALTSAAGALGATGLALASPITGVFDNAMKAASNASFAPQQAEKTVPTATGQALVGPEPETDYPDWYKAWADKHPDAANALSGAIDLTQVMPVTKAGINLVKEIPGAIKAATKASPKVAEDIIDLIRTRPENMTIRQKRVAEEAGRRIESKNPITRTETIDYKPTDEELRANDILKGFINKKDSKGQIISKVKEAISTKGLEAEKYLDNNKQFVTKVEQNNFLTNLISKADQTMTSSELNTYKEQIELFKKQLPKDLEMSTGDYYRALKSWEKNIAEHLPKGQEALLDPTGVASAKIHAAADIRTLARDLISSKHPEFKDRMYDIMALFQVKPTVIENAVKSKSSTIFQRNPKTTKAVGAGIVGAGVAGTSYNFISQ